MPLQRPSTTTPVDTIPTAVGELYANDQYLDQRVGEITAGFGPAVTASFGTTAGTIAEGAALTAEIARAQAAEGANATALGTKAPLDSPALTGTPTAPTAAAGALTNQVATTAFATSAVSVEQSRAQAAETALQNTLNTKANASDLLGVAQDTLTALAGKVDIGGAVNTNTATPTGASTAMALADLFAARIPVTAFGVDMTGVADSTTAFAAALNSGLPVCAGPGTIRLVSTVNVTSRCDFQAAGTATILKYDALAGSAAAPVLDIRSSAVGSRLDNFTVDHQANTKGFAPTTAYASNIIAGSAILIQADDVSMVRPIVKNAFDNGISVVQFNGTTPVSGSPKRWSIRGARTFACGVGSIPKAGGGIDIATGSQGVVDDLVDVGSYAAFGLDVGAGGQGTFSNLVGIANIADPALASDGTGASNSGSFYIGSSDSTFTNLTSIASAGLGIWIDGGAKNTTLTNFYVKAPKKIGVLIKNGQSTLSNIVVNSPGFGSAAGTYDAVVIDSTASTTNNLVINGLFVNSEFNTARYGINRLGSGTVTGAVLNANFSGAVTATNNVPGTFGVVDGVALGGAWTDYTPTVTAGSGAFTTVSASGSYRLVGKTVSLRASVNVTSVGTATDVRFSLPFAPKNQTVFSGIETALTGKGVGATVSGGQTIAILKLSDGTNPLTSGYTLVVSGEYQIP